MTKEDIKAGLKQAEEFKAKYGEYPRMPIRIKYRFMSTKAEGDLILTRFGAYQIDGFPGLTTVRDEHVHDAVFLYDSKGRLFPNITEEMCVIKPTVK